MRFVKKITNNNYVLRITLLLLVIFLVPMISHGQTSINSSIFSQEPGPYPTQQTMLYSTLLEFGFIILPTFFIFNISYDFLFNRKIKSWRVLLKESIFRTLWLAFIALIVIGFFVWQVSQRTPQFYD
jgi:hypothetical protein